MASAKLIEYIRSSANQGYSVSSIRTNLINAGYTPDQVDAAMAEAFHKKSPLPWKPILAILVILVIITLLVYGVVTLLSPSGEVLRLTLEGVPRSLDAGSPLSFSRTAILGGADDSQTISISYEVINDQTRERVSADQESLIVSGTSKKSVDVAIPSSARPGKYTLRATMSYEDLEIVDTSSFTIAGEEAVAGAQTQGDGEVPDLGGGLGQQCVPSCNDYDSCTRDRCVSGSCVFDAVTPCCGNFECEAGENEATCAQDCKVRPLTQGEAIVEIRDRAEEMAKSDTGDAVTLCKSIAVVAQADSCLKEVANVADKSDVCSNINGVKLKDSCYLDFALKKKQTNVCEHITDRWMRQSCDIYTTAKT